MKNIMKRAWYIRRNAAENFRCPIMEINMSECLKIAWAEHRSGTKIDKEIKQTDPTALLPGIIIYADRVHNGHSIELATKNDKCYWKKTWRGNGAIDFANKEIDKLKSLARKNGIRFRLEDTRFSMPGTGTGDIKITEG